LLVMVCILRAFFLVSFLTLVEKQFCDGC